MVKSLKSFCSKCGQFKTVRKYKDFFICTHCYIEFYIPKRKCDHCNQIGPIAKNIDGKPICYKCYDKYYRHKAICSKCNTLSIIRKIVDDKPICPSCYNKFFYPKKICSICNKECKSAKNIEDKSFCISCYNTHFRPKKMCSKCGKEGIIEKTIDGKNICRSCYGKYYRPKKICSICGKLDISKKLIENKPICSTCYNKYYHPKHICSLCGKSEIIEMKLDNKNFCYSCYNKYYRERKICSICGKTDIVCKVLNDKNICPSCYNKQFKPQKICTICGKEAAVQKIDNGKIICPSCYYNSEGICTNCGNTSKGIYYFRGLCRNCWFNKKIGTLLLESKNTLINTDIYMLFYEYAKTIIDYRTPTSSYVNLLHQIAIFKFLDNEDINIKDITVEYINGLNRYFHYSIVQHLENFLLKKELFTPLSPFQSFNIFRNKYIKTLSDNFSTTLEEYTDYLICLSRKYKDRGWDNRLSYSTCIDYTYSSFLFLNFASYRVNSVRELNNHIVDDFIANYWYSSSHLQPFIKWVNKNFRFFVKLMLPKYHIKHVSGNPYNEEEFLTIIDSLLSSNSTFREKMICLLNLIYAIRPREISQLKLNHYIKDNVESFIFIRNKKILIHPFIAEFIDNYIKYERTSSMSLGAKEEWLLPGSKYDKPLGSPSIGFILRKYNINSHRAFSTAINNFLNQINSSPCIVINGLGLNISTVMTYYKELNATNTFELEYSNIDSTINRSIQTDKEIYYIYMLKCYDGSYYTGYTSDLQKRIQQHQNGTGCTYTKTRTPVELVYTEELQDKPSALKREKQIKKLTIFDKEKLIKKSRANEN